MPPPSPPTPWKTPKVFPPLIVTRLPPSMVVSALMVLVLVTVIVAGSPPQLNVTAPLKPAPPGSRHPAPPRCSYHSCPCPRGTPPTRCQTRHRRSRRTAYSGSAGRWPARGRNRVGRDGRYGPCVVHTLTPARAAGAPAIRHTAPTIAANIHARSAQVPVDGFMTALLSEEPQSSAPYVNRRRNGAEYPSSDSWTVSPHKNKLRRAKR